MKRNGQTRIDNFFRHGKRLAIEQRSGNSQVAIDVGMPSELGSRRSEQPGTSKYRGFRAVQEKDPSYYESVAEELRKMGDSIIWRLTKQSWKTTHRFFSDVFVVRNGRECKGLTKLCDIAGANYGGDLFFYVVDSNPGEGKEKSHIHVVHDCSYSNRSCRCVWRSEILSKFQGCCKQAIGTRKFISSLSVVDWTDEFIYYFLRKWGSPAKIWFRREDQRLPTASDALRWEEMQRKFSEILAGSDRWLSDNLFEEGQGDQGDSTDVTRSGWRNVRKQGTQFDSVYETIQALLEKYPSAPLSAIKIHEQYRQQRWLLNPKYDRMIYACIEDFGLRLNNFTLRDFYNFYSKKGCEPVFTPSKIYYDVNRSEDILTDLLKFQFDDDDGKISNFLNSMVDIVDKRLSKTNTLVVIAPPSSGKNFFFDCLFSICINVGQFSNANKYNNFPFQEAPHKRLLYWNEPNYCSSYTEELKKILGTDNFVVRVKNKPDTDCQRTPVIVLTNNSVNFMNDKAFKERIIKFVWKRPEWLKDYNLKPHPMAIFSLLNKYNIEYYKIVLLSSSI